MTTQSVSGECINQKANIGMNTCAKTWSFLFYNHPVTDKALEGYGIVAGIASLAKREAGWLVKN